MNDIIETISFILRLAAPFIAVITIILCFVSLRYGRRSEHALINLEDEEHEICYPVLFWENSIGRSRNSDIRINDATVSRDHAVLLRRDDGWFVTDTGSKSGVYVNGNLTEGRCPVYIGDKIAIGKSILTLRRADASSDIHQRQKRKPRESKTLPGSVLLSFITVYILVISAEAVINMGSLDVVIPAACFILLCWIFFALSKSMFKRKNFELESLALLLSGTGIVLCASHDSHQAIVQLAATVIGIFIFCFIIWFIEIPDRVMKWRLAISILAICLLGSTLALGTVQNGAKNWILLGPISVQPSEFAKIAYIFVGASTLDQLQTKKNLFGFIIVTGACVGLLFLMSDFGTAVIFFVTFLIIAFMRSGNIKTVILAVTAAVLGVLVILTVKPYIAERFKAWGHVWEYAADAGYQQVNTLIYSASGGLFGIGLSKGYLQNVFASESDLVFGLASEEMGLIIAVLFGVVIGGFMIYARTVTTRSRSTFYSIAACTAGGMLVFQAALNIFGVTDILPLTGVTLPFVSYGGSSMAACWGILAFIKAADERTYSGKKIKRHKERKKQNVSYRTQMSDTDTEEYIEV